ncbi:MAG: hypothetical protein HC925_01130 [Coleofasciculaceae cyanobacterium SM2_3_26]|nr:hypothetical protein [Coleofasciculaceae cyanobacterium SM2_3_26]
MQEWFGDWYQKERSLIQLDLGESVLPVEFLVEEFESKNTTTIQPFWEEVAYLGTDADQESDRSAIETYQLELPTPYADPPSLITFYSFKGGVGRTIHLAAYLFALLERAKEIDNPIKVLVIDADLEAPGLTYWDRLDGQQSTVTFIDFLEAYHYSPLPTQETLSLLAEEIKKSSRREGRSVFYFLPAFARDEQLLDAPVLPQHLARSPEGEWTCSNAIYKLGKAINVDYILIDLPTGINEISSPFIFDPRLQRFLVTTLTKESLAGSNLVLKQIGGIFPANGARNNSNTGIYFDPCIIVSLLTPQLKSLPEFGNALTALRNSYAQVDRIEENDLFSKQLEVRKTDFSQELLYVNSWEEAQQKLSSTSIMSMARAWAASQRMPLRT